MCYAGVGWVDHVEGGGGSHRGGVWWGVSCISGVGHVGMGVGWVM